jgi:hypothetical protein
MVIKMNCKLRNMLHNYTLNIDLYYLENNVLSQMSVTSGFLSIYYGDLCQLQGNSFPAR